MGERELAGMLDRISYRGPDDRGTYLDRHFALGNLLLAIVDIGNGRQPLVREFRGETYVAVFNGEIYNYLDLRRELIDQGVEFSTNCDTEVALAAFAVWGESAASRFDGQWALAVWAVNRRRLFLTRDPFGIKPLFYHHQGDFIAFASEPKAILTLPNVPKRPDLDALREYFLHGFAFAAGYSLNHRSFYEGIRSLPPGSFLFWTSDSSPKITRYFHYPLAAQMSGQELHDTARLLEGAVRRSTEASMMGDAPIGVALSGGLDSSVITAIAARVSAERGKSPLLASCITYRSQNRNEDEDHARLLSQWLGPGSPVHLIFSVMEVDSYLVDLDSMIHHFDEPHWEIKQLAMFNNYRALKANGAKVVLTGEGADELFFGYYHQFPGFKNPVIRSTDDFRGVWKARIPDALRLLANTEAGHLEALQEEAIARFYQSVASDGANPDRCMQCWYLATFLHWLLIDNDRCSMAFSLEGRFPFLNRAVYEMAFRIPPSAQVGSDHGHEKLVLRNAFKNALPEQIWRRRRKAPLPSPLKLAFHHPIRDALRAEVDRAPADVWEILDRSGVNTMLEAYSARITDLQRKGLMDDGGDELTRYLRLDEPWSVRTPHAFGLLTFFRWWKLNFA
ncbi:MAG: asparagine synthase (glutamine-hydrolyzing) [Acidobacteria bacterium]|nr:asparagine synthase (glutamine-hydrolyzing) [Acidobacteriota bacterium]